MSRITYKSEEEVRSVAARLRAERIPCDAIHLDTGWFETDWQCNFEFAPSRFPDPAGMIEDLRKEGFRISLWQLPYFTSKNALFEEALQRGYFVKNAGGAVPHEDGILDFTNSDAVNWYQRKLRGLLELGVGAIKVDFGEDAPLAGVYASGRTGYYEHNLYPLRYNQVVADLTREVTGENIIWARSAWAGSQRYPVHWGGDAENTDSAMAATLRAGLSLGLCGFTYWSHDAGGFVETAPRDLYRRWLPFAALTSHTRCHGQPPREPWEYDEAFVDEFRAAVELKYRLMPYIYAQAVECSRQGHPLLRTLFCEFPDDPTSWLIEDQYMLGSDLLVAPMFSNEPARRVYLPPGTWFDYQSTHSYNGGAWVRIAPGPVPCVVLVRAGAAVAHAAVAQSTNELNWQDLELRVYAVDGAPAQGLVALPGDKANQLRLECDSGGDYRVIDDPLAGRVTWKISRRAPTDGEDAHDSGKQISQAASRSNPDGQ
jgi:alpha-D-xyloside xylohydrolase